MKITTGLVGNNDSLYMALRKLKAAAGQDVISRDPGPMHDSLMSLRSLADQIEPGYTELASSFEQTLHKSPADVTISP